MSLSVRSVHNHGNASDELVIIDVIKACNLQYWMICDTTFQSSTHISDKLRHMFWFPDKQVSAGDVVVLHTKIGTNTSRPMANGYSRHDLFWQLRTSVWNNDYDAAVLFEIKDWLTSAVR